MRAGFYIIYMQSIANQVSEMIKLANENKIKVLFIQQIKKNPFVNI